MDEKIFFILAFILITGIVSCKDQAATQTNSALEIDELAVDSIYENFENIAYTKQELYTSNPDSLLQTLMVKPITSYQKELYNYGLIFIGYALMNKGYLHESIKYYEKAYDFKMNNKIPIEDFNNIVIKPLANLYTRIDDTEKAINILQKTIQSSNHHDQIIGLNNNLATAYIYNNEIQKAERLLIDNLEKTNNTKHKALLYNNLSNLYFTQKEIEKSRKFNNLALTEFERGQLKEDTLTWYLGALGLSAQLNHETRFTEKALKIANKEYPNAQNRLKAKLTVIEADLLAVQNNPFALERYRTTMDLLNTANQQFVLDYTYTQSLLGIARYFKNSQQLDSALLYYERSIENDFRTQQLITSAKDQINNNIYNKNNLEELISLIQTNDSLVHNPEVVKKLLWCIELSKARLLINEIHRSDQWINADPTIKTNVEKIKKLYQLKDETTSTVKKENIQKQINALLITFQLSEKYFEALRFEPNKETFLKNLEKLKTDFYSYYIDTNDKITLIHKNKSSYRYHQISDSSFLQRLSVFKNDYFGSSPSAYNNNPKLFQDQSQEFTKALLPNLKESNVFVSLDGDLYGLPFDALYDQDFLIQTHNFAYLNSFLLFDILENKNTSNNLISLLFRTSYPAPLPTLNFVDREIQNLSSIFKTEKIGVNQQTDHILKEQFAKSNIIHIAAHTILDSTEAPTIFLKNQISTNQLRYFEINSPLVFLSACNTGKGEALASEGTESISRIFLSKNVPSVISTYWFANDEVMLHITNDFYQCLASSHDPILALAQAKRLFLHAASNQLQNPWYWANINYTGVGNKIGLKKSSNLLVPLVLGVLLLTVVLHRLRLYHSFIEKTKKTDNKPK